MNQEQTGPEFPPSERMPQQINEGMLVYDGNGDLVGTVKVVYFGGANEEAIERALHPESGESDFANLPEDAGVRLMRQGYITVDGPELTGAKTHISPEQIEGIFPVEIEGTITDIVRLRVSRNELTS